MKPESRRDQLIAERVGNELVIYDERTHEAHRLNSTAALVWNLADGSRSRSALAASLRESVTNGGERLETEDSEELVRMALEELDRAGLLVRGLPKITETMSRRQMIAVTAALIPVAASIVAPTPAMAITIFPPGNQTAPGAARPQPPQG